MTKFSHVIVRRPPKSIVHAYSGTPELGRPNYELAIKQHDAYIDALRQCGVEVTILPALEYLTNSVFVEDTSVVTRKGAIVDNPGMSIRQPEATEMEPTLRKFFTSDQIAHITLPGTLEGGDVMMVGDHFYVGRSTRTNPEGIRQFIEILEGWGLEGSEVPLDHTLHLKTGVNYLENNNLLVAGEFIDKPEFASFNKYVVPEEEAYGANCIWVNDTVIVPEGYPNVLQAVKDFGYKTITVDVSEFRKLGGGLSCMSLRF